MKLLLGAILGLSLLLLPNFTLPTSQGSEWNAQQPLSAENVILEKNIVYMHISGDSKLPFACVWGTVSNAAQGYPVVIQIYKDGKPVYFAQTNVKSDGTYEQYFRVKSVDGDKITQIFEGDYTVDIYKTVIKNTASGTST